jgi:hypothetical protein
VELREARWRRGSFEDGDALIDGMDHVRVADEWAKRVRGGWLGGWIPTSSQWKIHEMPLSVTRVVGVELIGLRNVSLRPSVWSGAVLGTGANIVRPRGHGR